jgi:hypothetical protein
MGLHAEVPSSPKEKQLRNGPRLAWMGLWKKTEQTDNQIDLGLRETVIQLIECKLYLSF